MNDPSMRKTFVLTAGSTHEHLDDVRFITNHASGALPCAIAELLVQSWGQNCVYIHGPGAKIPQYRTQGLVSGQGRITLVPCVSAADMHRELTKECLELQPYGVVCAAAVADFAPMRVSGKIPSSTQDPEGDSSCLTLKLFPTPKVIDVVKQVSPDSHLLGFKFLAGSTQDQLFDAAHHLMERAGCRAVFANSLESYQNRSGFLLSTSPDGKPTVNVLDGKGQVKTLAHLIIRAWLLPRG